MGLTVVEKLLKNGVPIVTVFELPVLAEAQTADRFLTNLPEMCGPTGKIAPLPLPMSMAEARQRGWDELDVVIVSGDAYIDHPSFAMSILGRVLEAAPAWSCIEVGAGRW